MQVNERTCRPVNACLPVVLACIILSGCAPNYTAPELPRSEVAVILTDSDELTIISVDNRRVSLLPESGPRQATVAPGEHTIKVRHKRNGHFADGSLTVEVEAGGRYIIRSASQGYNVMFWVENKPAEAGRTI